MTEYLYAWANKMQFLQQFELFQIIPLEEIKKAEHTWVTTYKPGEGSPDPEKGDYWYCNGSIHNKCRLIAIGKGGADFARQLASPHDEFQDMGIRYAKDGLCHQMANRLLRFSFDENGNPITVQDAIGYQLSCAMFGVYGGENAWGNIKTFLKYKFPKRDNSIIKEGYQLIRAAFGVDDREHVLENKGTESLKKWGIIVSNYINSKKE